MKKLLSLLGAVAIGASATTSAVSFSYGPSMGKFIKKEMDFYSQISAQAFKSGILADQDLKILGKNYQGLSVGYTSDTLGNVLMSKGFSSLIDPKQGAKPTPTDKVTNAYRSVFGNAQGGVNYTIASSYQSLKDANGFKKDSNLGKLINGTIQDKDLKKPDPDGVSSMLNMIAGVANIAFKNDFSPSMAQTVIGVLTGSTAQNAVSGAGDVFNMINSVVTDNSEQIRSVIDSLTQERTAAGLADKKQAEGNSYQDVLTDSTQNLFKGLIYFVSGMTKQYDESAKKDASWVFWNYLTKDGKDEKKNIGVKKAKKPDFENKDVSALSKTLPDFIYAISEVLDFATSLVHYFRAFDAQFPKIKPLDGNHLFDDEISNDRAIKKVLDTLYVSSDKDRDEFWYTEKAADGVHITTKFNLQNLVSDLQYYLCPTDLTGYATLRAISTLLGNPTDGFNPIVSVATKPLLDDSDNGILYQLIFGLLKKIPNIPSVLDDGTRNTLTSAAVKTIENLISVGGIDWFTTDGYADNSHVLVDLINDAAKIYGTVNVPALLGSVTDPQTKTILGIVDAVVKYWNSSNGQSFKNRPWSTLFGGQMLIHVGQTVQNVDSHDNTLFRVGQGLKGLIDLRTILISKAPVLLKNIGTIIGSPIDMPDWLYGAKNLSISSLVNKLGSDWLSGSDVNNPDIKWTTTATSKLSENNRYAFNSGALGEIVESLIPAKDGESKTIVYDDLTNKPVSIIKPLYYAIKYWGDQGTEVTDDKFQYSIKLEGSDKPIQILGSTPFADPANNKNKINVSNEALNDLLGLNVGGDNKYSFIPGSLLNSLSRIYGHGYKDADGKPVDYTEMFNASSSIFALLTKFAQFTVDSVSELVSENYYKYFDPKNWKITDLKQTNLDNERPTQDTIQTLDYDLWFYNPDVKRGKDTGKWFKYHVSMHRQAIDTSSTTGDTSIGWILDQLMRITK